MKIFASIAAAAAMFASTSAFAAPVTVSFQNVGTAAMTVSNVTTCASISPTPAAVAAGATSPQSVTDCGSPSTAVYVTYKIGTKQCVFRASSQYNPSTGWTPNANFTASSGATCKVVSQDVSAIFTTGAYKVVFSMK